MTHPKATRPRWERDRVSDETPTRKVPQMSTAVEFKDPPQDGRAGRSSTRWVEVAGALKERPGEWAVVATDVAATTTSAIKNAVLVAFRPAGSFEARARGVVNSRAAEIYARYVGGDTE